MVGKPRWARARATLYRSGIRVSFDWTEYLSIAEALCGMAVSGSPASVEAQQRAAVSRAYYAAFILARNRLRDVDHVTIPATGTAHRLVAEQYEQHREARRRQIGLELNRLRISRNRCDYDDVVAGLPQLARQSLARAGIILAVLGRL